MSNLTPMTAVTSVSIDRMKLVDKYLNWSLLNTRIADRLEAKGCDSKDLAFRRTVAHKAAEKAKLLLS